MNIEIALICTRASCYNKDEGAAYNERNKSSNL